MLKLFKRYRRNRTVKIIFVNDQTGQTEDYHLWPGDVLTITHSMNPDGTLGEVSLKKGA